MKNLLNYFTREPKKTENSQNSNAFSASEPKKTEDSQNSKVFFTPKPNPEIKNSPPSVPQQSLYLSSIKERGNAIFDENEYELPDFLRKQNIKDIEGRRPDDPGYDPTTLFVPATYKSTPAMAQYWEIKKHHFDKILLFKLGKFYELFYLDALTVQPILELKWMGDEKKKMHVGFPEKTLEKNAAILVSRGLKIVVVEQTETTLKNRIKKTGKVVGREVTEVLTKSTYSAHYMEESYEPSYLLSVVEIQDEIGFVLGDFSVSELIVGHSKLESFLNFIVKARPVEVVFNSIFLSDTLIKMFKTLSNPPILSQIRNHDSWNPLRTDELLGERFSSELSELPKATTIRALSGMLSYMKDSLILEKVIPGVKIRNYDSDSFGKNFMVLDRQSIEHLEILEAKSGKSKSSNGSLFEFINQCITPFGKRLLKKWLLAPLMNIQSINSRLDAVEELTQNSEARRWFESYTQKVPDIERILARLASLTAKTQSKAVYFENVSSKQITMLVNFLKQMKEFENMINSLETCSLESAIFTKLCKFNDAGGQFPHLYPICEKILANIDRTNEDNPIPVPGYCQSYDEINLKVEEIKEKLNHELNKERARFGNNPEINLVDSKFRYELEVPVYLIKKEKPANYEETSAKNGFQRYYTKEIKKLADEIEIAEDSLKKELRPFLSKILNEFMEVYEVWKRVIEIVAEFDCLLSLAKVSVSQKFNMTRPFFSEDPSKLSASDLFHPILANRVLSFIPNDINFTPSQSTLVLTGPNMGGKSTVLRKLCLCLILAQIGSFVPASFLHFCPVDRIFTRLGANDSLLQGLSTFAVEMNEASKFFLYGTSRSMVIMDELGRGTSTQDGSAIALAVLQYLARSGAKTIFTTHYHMLIEDIKKIQGVRLVHMDSVIDEESKKVVFLYKLRDGECPKSYGLNVARMAGVSSEILDIASRVARCVEEKQARILEKKRKLELV